MPATPAIVDLDGDAYDRGVQHGRQCAGKIRQFLNDGLGRLDTFLGPGIRLRQFREELLDYGAAIARQTPDIHQEITGLCEGACITIEEALLLQTRRELAGYSRFQTCGDCTTFARTHNTPVLGQTIDLAGDMDDHITVLRLRDSTSGHRSLLLSFTGLLGYLGVNDCGLAVGLNLLLAGEWRPGLPPYLAIRHLLDTCTSVEQAITRLHKLKLASSRSFMLCDTSDAAFVEAQNGKLSITRGDELVHTNHYLDPAFAERDELNIFAQNGSRKRLDACKAWLKTHPAGCPPETYFQMLSAAPINVPDIGNRSVEKTVAAVVLDPVNHSLHLRAGDPSGTVTTSFDMSGTKTMAYDVTGW